MENYFVIHLRWQKGELEEMPVVSDKVHCCFKE